MILNDHDRIMSVGPQFKQFLIIENAMEKWWKTETVGTPRAAQTRIRYDAQLVLRIGICSEDWLGSKKREICFHISRIHNSLIFLLFFCTGVEFYSFTYYRSPNE